MAEAEAEASRCWKRKRRSTSRQLEAATEEAPVVKLVNIILTDSIKKSASDIHLEPYEKDFCVSLPHRRRAVRDHAPADEAQGRDHQPAEDHGQAGHLRKAPAAGRPHQGQDQAAGQDQGDGLPRLGSADAVRREDRSAVAGQGQPRARHDRLGFEPESLAKFERQILKPYGMVLVTGPTGSGKTNTLYSSMHRVNTPETNIMTAEDPVEFNLHGINQVQMKEQIGLNFAAALRSLPAPGSEHRPGRRDP